MDDGVKSGLGKGGTAGQAAGDEDSGGNESDEWSDDDEVHLLPKEIKAQFGNVSNRCRAK